MRNKIIFALCAALMFAAHAASSTNAWNAPNETCDLDYQIEAKWDEAPRRFDVTLSFDVDEKGEATLLGPKSWGGVDNFDKTILNVRAISDGTSLKPVESDQWIVSQSDNPKKRVSVRYSIINGIGNIDDATPISHRDFHRNTLGKEHFHLIGYGALLWPQRVTGENYSTCITFTGLPATWSFASSFSAEQQSGVAKIRFVGSLQQIRGAVYLGGDYRILRREIEGKPLLMALRGTWSFTDDKFADATAALVRTHRVFWNDFDFPHYLIALTPNRSLGTSNGGTGLHNAFTMHASPNFSVPGSQFDALIGHEHLHTWMPKRIGSMGGNDQPLRYWFSEGFTNYLTHRLLLQSGIWPLQQYAESLNGVIASYLMSPDVNASNERVLKEFWSNRSSIGNLPYLRGELLALRWANLLSARGKSLERHLQALAKKADEAPGRGTDDPAFFAATRLRSALRADLGDAVDSDIDKYIERGETIPINEQFLGHCFDATFQDRALFELGFDSAASFSNRLISGVVKGSAAERAGLRDGMTMKGWSARNGDSTRDVSVTVIENNEPREIKFLPASAKTIRLPVFTVKKDSATSAACAAWMPKLR
jgi:predicted metalloprotease with PDZ domain